MYWYYICIGTCTGTLHVCMYILLKTPCGGSTAAPHFGPGRSAVGVRSGRVLGRFSDGYWQFLTDVGFILGAKTEQKPSKSEKKRGQILIALKRLHKIPAPEFLGGILATLARLGAVLGPKWGPKASQKQKKSYQTNQ
jgi:hypothetical protein